MYSKILVPMALDHGVSENTLEVAKALAAPGAQILALHVYQQPQGSVAAFLDTDAVKEGIEGARRELARKTGHLSDVTAELITGHTYRSIIDYAAKHGIECIVMGSHKPGLSDYLLGSTAARVVRHAPCAVHVYRSF